MPKNLKTLPTEIQREIYRNLLLGSRLRTGTTTYQFHTNILRVSKSVFSISHQVLYNENDFVLFREGTMQLMQNLRPMRVPIVSCHVPEFEEHRLSISFGEYVPSPSKLHRYPRGPCPHGSGPSCSLGSFDCDLATTILLHAQDSALYIRAFALLEHCIWFPTRERLLVRSERGIRPFATEIIGGSRPHEAAAVVIGAEMNSYDEQDLDKSWKQRQWQIKERQLLSPFRGMSSTRRMVLNGVEVTGLHSVAGELQVIMSPPVVWLRSMGWHFVHALRSLKSDLDALVRGENGDQKVCIDEVLIGYDFLLKTLRSATICKLEYMTSTSFGNLDWQDALCTIGRDTAYTLIQILFHQGHHQLPIIPHSAVAPWYAILQTRGTGSILQTPEQRRIIKHFQTLNLAMHGRPEMALRKLKLEISRAILDQVGEEEIEHLRRDLTFLRIHIQASQQEQHPEITLTRTTSHGIGGGKSTLLKCAQVKKPPEKCIFPDSVVFEGPRGLKGWLDMNERLTKGDLESLGVSATDLPAELLAEG